MKWIEKSFYFANCIFLLYVIFYYVILETQGDANPQNLPLKLLPFVVAVASVSMISMALGPPTTSIGTLGIVYLIIFTNLQPGSDIHGIPASLTTATCLLSNIFLIISNIFVYEYVFNGTNNPLPFFVLVFAISSQICLQSDIQIPYNSSNFYVLLRYKNYYCLFMIFLALYFKQSILNCFSYYSDNFDRNFLRCLSFILEYQQNWCFLSTQSFGIYVCYYCYYLNIKLEIPIVPNFYYIFFNIFLLYINVYNCPATLLSQHPIISALNKHFNILGVRSDKLPIGVATMLNFPLGFDMLISFMTVKLQQIWSRVFRSDRVRIIIIKYGEYYYKYYYMYDIVINRIGMPYYHFLNRLFNFQRADINLTGPQGCLTGTVFEISGQSFGLIIFLGSSYFCYYFSSYSYCFQRGLLTAFNYSSYFCCYYLSAQFSLYCFYYYLQSSYSSGFQSYSSPYSYLSSYFYQLFNLSWYYYQYSQQLLFLGLASSYYYFCLFQLAIAYYFFFSKYFLIPTFIASLSLFQFYYILALYVLSSLVDAQSYLQVFETTQKSANCFCTF